MIERQRHLLAEALRSLEAARLLHEGGFYGFSASRSYYAMFYVAEAILLSKGLTFSKHAGVVSAFGQHFVKTGEIKTEYHRFLIHGMEIRHVGDYGRSSDVSSEQCEQQLKNAEAFIKLGEELIGPLS